MPRLSSVKLPHNPFTFAAPARFLRPGANFIVTTGVFEPRPATKRLEPGRCDPSCALSRKARGKPCNRSRLRHRRKRSRHVRNPLVILINLVITLAVFGLAAVGGALYFGKKKFEEPGPLAEDATVVISSGSGLSGITDRLAGPGCHQRQHV